MDRGKFMKRMNEMRNSEIYDNDKIKELCRENVNKGHITSNLFICMEELAELSKEISKMYRYGLTMEGKYGLIEEMADVSIIIQYLQQLIKIPDHELKAARTIKIQKIEKWLEEYPEGDRDEKLLQEKEYQRYKSDEPV